MALWDRWFARSRDEPPKLVGGRVTKVDEINRTLSPNRSRVKNLLETLRRIPEESAALDFLRRENADVSMAVWNFIRLANQGHKMEFYDLTKKRLLPEIEVEWRSFAARVNAISNSGLDGLLDILHLSAFLKGAQGIEVEIADDLMDIVDVYPVIPQSIYWQLEKRDGRVLWIPYQWQNGNQVSLEPGKANFLWVPTDPDIDDPRGNLLLAPVLQSIDFQLQILQDLQAVLHHQGYPRHDISIVMERVVAAMPGDVRANSNKQKEWLYKHWQDIVTMFRELKPDDSFIHFDDVVVNMNAGANASRSLDVRAIAELVDTQTLSGAKQMAIFMNRNTGITESWGTVQFRIFCSGIASVQRGSKRLLEEIARLWLRVRGIQAIPVFTHNTIDWVSEEQRMNVKLLEQQFWGIAQLMGWASPDTAAQKVIGAERAVGRPVDTARVSFSNGDQNARPEAQRIFYDKERD